MQLITVDANQDEFEAISRSAVFHQVGMIDGLDMPRFFRPGVKTRDGDALAF
jgi:hypothetical protein